MNMNMNMFVVVVVVWSLLASVAVIMPQCAAIPMTFEQPIQAIQQQPIQGQEQPIQQQQQCSSNKNHFIAHLSLLMSNAVSFPLYPLCTARYSSCLTLDHSAQHNVDGTATAKAGVGVEALRQHARGFIPTQQQQQQQQQQPLHKTHQYPPIDIEIYARTLNASDSDGSIFGLVNSVLVEWASYSSSSSSSSSQNLLTLSSLLMFDSLECRGSLLLNLSLHNFVNTTTTNNITSNTNTTCGIYSVSLSSNNSANVQQQQLALEIPQSFATRSCISPPSDALQATDGNPCSGFRTCHCMPTYIYQSITYQGAFINCFGTTLYDFPALPTQTVALVMAYTHLQNVVTPSAISADVQHSLVSLDLTYSQITGLHHHFFRNMTNLVVLILKVNNLTLFWNHIVRHNSTPFDTLTALTTLDLSYTNLRGEALIPALFSHLTSLSQLILAGNGITAIPNDLFGNLANIINLDLSNNMLETLSLQAFRGSPFASSARRGWQAYYQICNSNVPALITLSGNPISVLHRGTFAFLPDPVVVRLSDASTTPEWQPFFTTCCGLDWLINSPSKYYIAPRTVRCIHPFNQSIMFVDDLRGSPICPCVLYHSNSTTPYIARQNSSECDTVFSWILINNICTKASTCPPGQRLAPTFITLLYNCSYVQKSPFGNLDIGLTTNTNINMNINTNINMNMFTQAVPSQPSGIQHAGLQSVGYPQAYGTDLGSDSYCFDMGFDMTCEMCAVQDCRLCPASLSTCSGCSSNKFLLNNTCVSTCPQGYRRNIADYTCEECVVNACAMCAESANKCDMCLSDAYQLLGGDCIACTDDECSNCANDYRVCESCSDAYYLTKEGTCVTSCPDGTAANAQYQCIDVGRPKNLYGTVFGAIAVVSVLIFTAVYIQRLHHRNEMDLTRIERNRAIEDYNTVRSELQEAIDRWCLEYSCLEITGFLGRGAFGEVKSARLMPQGRPVAVKLLLPEMLIPEYKTQFIQEVDHLIKVVGAHIVEFIGFGFKPGDVVGEEDVPFLVIELMERGTLQRILATTEVTALPQKTRLKYGLHAARGLQAMHQRHRIHRDVKSANMLVNQRGVLKIADLGAACFADISRNHIRRAVPVAPGELRPLDSSFESAAGTVEWTAPEVFSNRITAQCDVYSYGVLLWELATHKLPWTQFPPPNYELVRQAVEAGERPQYDATKISADYQALMTMCWDADPYRRPTFNDIVKHAVFASVTHL